MSGISLVSESVKAQHRHRQTHFEDGRFLFADRTPQIEQGAQAPDKIRRLVCVFGKGNMSAAKKPNLLSFRSPESQSAPIEIVIRMKISVDDLQRLLIYFSYSCQRCIIMFASFSVCKFRQAIQRSTLVVRSQVAYAATQSESSACFRLQCAS